MASYAKNIEDGDFHNWLKSALALLFTKEGLEDFVIGEITGLQQDLLRDIYRNYGIPAGTICSHCSTANVLKCKTQNFCPPGNKACNVHSFSDPVKKPNQPCPVNLCLYLRDSIRKKHRYNNPSWKNTDATGWCRDPFQLSKCFMPPDGYTSVTNIHDTDFNGIISVIMNSKRFSTKFADNLGHEPNVCSELKADTLSIESKYLSQVIEDIIRENTGRSLTAIETAKLKALEEIKEESARRDMTLEGIYKSFNERVTNYQLTAVFVQTNIQANIYSSVPEPSDHHESVMLPYGLMRKDLQDDLITFYKDQYSFISVSPLLPENDARLLDIYVEPNMEIASWNAPVHKAISSPRMPVQSYKDIFMNGHSLCRNIYVCAHAGIGKTTFAKKLCMTWCCAHKNEDSDEKIITKEDAETMKIFDFLFFLPLRDVSGRDCDVDTMICNHILEYLSHQTDQYANFLKEILHRERCLVILEGLDEWSRQIGMACTKHSDIPNRRAREKCTILSTTREWKMNEVRISCSKVDKYIIMRELGNVSADTLLQHIVLSLTGSKENVHSAQKYISQIKQKGKSLAELASTPLILVHLLCLWHDERSVGESISEIYYNVTEFMLQYTEAKTENIEGIISGLQASEENKRIEAPVRLRKYKYICRCYTFILLIAELAFTALFKAGTESSLVFDSSKVRSIMSEDQLRYCLQMGLLTENKPRFKSQREVTFSFAHKSFQDYFVALFLESRHPTLVQDVLMFCNNIERILEMSHVFAFLGGINSEVLECIFEKLAYVVHIDPLALKYRDRTAVMNSTFWKSYTPFKRYQDMCITCFRESALKYVKIPIEDFVVDGDIYNVDYFRALNSLFLMNAKNMESLIIRNLDFKTVQKFMYNINYGLFDRLSKLVLITELEGYFIDSLLLGSAKTLTTVILHSDQHVTGVGFRPHRLIPFSGVSLNVLQALRHLETLILECFTLSHHQLDKLIKFVTDRKNLKQIGMGAIRCIEHGDLCAGFPIDLSLHRDLQTLELGVVPLSFVRIETSQLKECNVGDFQNENILPLVFDCLKGAAHLKAIEFFDMDNARNIENVLFNLNSDVLSQIEVLEMNNIDLTRQDIRLSSTMVNLKCVWLDEVKMSVNSIINIIKTVSSFPITVLMHISACTVTPRLMYEVEKQRIRSLRQFEVIIDTNDVFELQILNT